MTNYEGLSRDELDRLYLQEYQRLAKKFPRLYTKVMCGISFHLAWGPVIDELSEEIEKIVMEDNLTEFKVDQVKEKFGGLRYYVSGANDRVYKAIAKAEKKIETMCVVCGEPGKLCTNGWWTVYCDKHKRPN